MYACRECGKEIIWLRHKDTGKPAPIETEPAGAEGNIAISREKGLYRVATANERDIAKLYGKNLYLNHFSTCEFARFFVKPG